MDQYAGQERDFTEEHYRELLRLAARSYRFAAFTEAAPADKHIFWRHDIDISPQRALALARIEADAGVQSTFFVLLHSEMYNALELEVTRVIRELAALGHHLGLHFDPGFYGGRGELEPFLRMERDVLRNTFNVPIDCFSWHNPSAGDWIESVAADEIAGMVNVYGTTLRSTHEYVSDSHGIWRFRRLHDVLEAASDPALHVLTHPEWWVAEAMPPRARITRAIEGRAARSHLFYDDGLAASGRPNVR